jgi:hypothetical protein
VKKRRGKPGGVVEGKRRRRYEPIEEQEAFEEGVNCVILTGGGKKVWSWFSRA